MEKNPSVPKTSKRKLEWAKAYGQRPEVKARRKKYLKEYRARKPETKESTRERGRISRAVRPIICKWGVYRHSAKIRGLQFALTKPEFKQLLSSLCHYCYAEPSPVNGIDRVDNDAGYTPENCVPCCKLCNRAKADLPIEDFLAWLAQIAIAHAK